MPWGASTEGAVPAEAKTEIARCFSNPHPLWKNREDVMSQTYVHGYDRRENERLQDQAGTLVDLLHSDTSYPAGSSVLEVGCGVGAQTIPLARRSPLARFTAIDVSGVSLVEAAGRTRQD